MKVIVGLGNPEKRYAKTRHNVGFTVVDQLVVSHQATWRVMDRFKAEIAEGEGSVYAKPLTYMNASGEAVRALSDFYKLSSEDILVIHDDADIDFGKLRVVQGGNDGGHNGIASLIQHGLSGVWRLKIGVANERRQPGQAIDFVLTDFMQDEQQQLETLLTQKNNPVESICGDFLTDSLEATSKNWLQ